MSEQERPVESETGQRAVQVYVTRPVHRQLPVDGMAQAVGCRPGAWVRYEDHDHTTGRVWLTIMCPDYVETPWGEGVPAWRAHHPQLLTDGAWQGPWAEQPTAPGRG